MDPRVAHELSLLLQYGPPAPFNSDPDDVRNNPLWIAKQEVRRRFEDKSR